MLSSNNAENKDVSNEQQVSNYRFFFDILLVSMLEYIGDSSFKSIQNQNQKVICI